MVRPSTSTSHTIVGPESHSIDAPHNQHGYGHHRTESKIIIAIMDTPHTEREVSFDTLHGKGSFPIHNMVRTHVVSHQHNPHFLCVLVLQRCHDHVEESSFLDCTEQRLSDSCSSRPVFHFLPPRWPTYQVVDVLILPQHRCPHKNGPASDVSSR
jgi:hypothetical protein